MAAQDGAADTGSVLDEASAKAPPGTVLPPRSIREIVEKTAGYVARNGMAFEEKLRQTQANNPKMTFLFPEDAYQAYYRWRLNEIKAGRGNAISAGRENEQQTGVSGKGREERKGPEKPEDFQFSARMPNISAQDLEVVKLTALFVAKNGRSWMTALSQREAGNFQFDFLRPQHSLYQFFSRLVDQYTDLLTGDSVDEGRPQKKRIAELERNVDNRFHVLERAKKRAEWVKYQEAQKVAKEEQDEKERITYAQIDWHDFVVVETVVFDERDENAELPAPTTLNDLQSASLEQKAAMSIAPNRRIEEAMPTFGDYDQFYGTQQPTPQPAASVLPPTTRNRKSTLLTSHRPFECHHLKRTPHNRPQHSPRHRPHKPINPRLTKTIPLALPPCKPIANAPVPLKRPLAQIPPRRSARTTSRGLKLASKPPTPPSARTADRRSPTMNSPSTCTSR